VSYTQDISVEDAFQDELWDFGYLSYQPSGMTRMTVISIERVDMFTGVYEVKLQGSSLEADRQVKLRAADVLQFLPDRD
jgi:hypothetical protein